MPSSSQRPTPPCLAMTGAEPSDNGGFFPLGIADRVLGVPCAAVKCIFRLDDVARKSATESEEPPAAIAVEGGIVPVLHLRRHLGFPPADARQSGFIVILELSMRIGKCSRLGLLVDTIHPVDTYSLERSPQ